MSAYKTETNCSQSMVIMPFEFRNRLKRKKKNTVKEMGNKLKWLVHLCAQIYDASVRCCWQILLVKPSSRNKQGLSQSLSYSSSLVLQKRTLGLRTLGEDEAAAKRVDEVYQDLLSFSIQYSSSQINNL